jgi:RNA polymerase sigma factor (sigma-70 family)
MHTSDDMQLLEQYASGHSEEAFSALVSRHVNLVYSAAMRSVNNPHQAEEITQTVFVTLARKSRGLRRGTVLSGWLYQTARLTASNFLRGETRRQQREQQALMQSTTNAPEPESWAGVGPLLDQAMAQLNEKDRDAIVLRFFEGKPLKEVGEALGASEDAAKMRVARALDKLRDFFHRRGMTVPASALAAAISENSIQAAPAGLAASVAAGASGVVPASALAVSSLTLAKGAIHIMTSTKIGVAIGGCAAAAIIVLQAQQVSTQKETLQQLEAQAAQQEQTSRAQQAEMARLREQNAFYAKTAENTARDVAKARARAAAALAEPAAAVTVAAEPKGGPLGAMFKDPAMLEAMRPQQLATIKMMYGPLVKQLNLSPEQADKFYDILVDNGLRTLQAVQSGQSSQEDIKSNNQSMEADLRSLLGEAGFSQYTDYTKNDMAGQTLFAAMKNDFENNPLSDTQQQQLLQAMKSARQSVNASNPLANGADKTASMDQVLQQQEQINQIVLQQAAAFLSPEQLQTLGASQSNTLAMQKSMAPVMQKMFPASSVAP